MMASVTGIFFFCLLVQNGRSLLHPDEQRPLPSSAASFFNLPGPAAFPPAPPEKPERQFQEQVASPTMPPQNMRPVAPEPPVVEPKPVNPPGQEPEPSNSYVPRFNSANSYYSGMMSMLPNYLQPSDSGKESTTGSRDSLPYDGVSGSTGGNSMGDGNYGGQTMKRVCTPFVDTTFEEVCIPYTEKVCYTLQKERCQDLNDKACEAIVTTNQNRACLNVKNLLCSLREDVQYEMVPSTFTVQKCHQVTERVCDTIYEAKLTNKDDFQCIQLANPSCHTVDKTIYDKTCRTTVIFNCDQAYGGGQMQHEAANEVNAGYGDPSGYGSSGGSGGSGGYGKTKCTRTPQTKCYTTPRTVQTQVCERNNETVCEKLNERVPVPVEREVCHNEQKRVCELEQRSQPKQVKKYVYTKQCRRVPATVCENADQMTLVKKCVPTQRKTCDHYPVEQCEDIPKKHCIKEEEKIKKEKCQMVPDYGNDEPNPSYDQGGFNPAPQTPPQPQPGYGSSGSDGFAYQPLPNPDASKY